MGNDVVFARGDIPGVIKKPFKAEFGFADVEGHTPCQSDLLAQIGTERHLIAGIPIDLEEIELRQFQIHRHTVEISAKTIAQFSGGSDQHILNNAGG